MTLLRLGGYINILISVAHLIGLIWAEQMFEVTGIGKEMNKLAQIHSSFPYLLTVFVAIVFLIFGLYGLSADGKFRKLPFLKLVIFSIAGIYIFRGIGELIFDISQQEASQLSETIYSLIALGIGLLFLIGGLKKWK
jgi:nitrate reductase gamma subunit